MPGMLQARALTTDEWAVLSDIRLVALKDSPQAFLSTYDREYSYRESDWRAEFNRGCWTVAYQQGKPVGLIGATREDTVSSTECYLEYLWVTPESRRCGVASSLINAVLQRLGQEGVSTVWLWILDGNESAAHFYEKHGFTFTGKKQPVTHSSKCFEELMCRRL